MRHLCRRNRGRPPAQACPPLQHAMPGCVMEIEATRLVPEGYNSFICLLILQIWVEYSLGSTGLNVAPSVDSATFSSSDHFAYMGFCFLICLIRLLHLVIWRYLSAVICTILQFLYYFFFSLLKRTHILFWLFSSQLIALMAPMDGWNGILTGKKTWINRVYFCDYGTFHGPLHPIT